MPRAAACATKKLPRRLVSRIKFQSSQVTSSAGLRTLQPALLTRISRPPKADSAATTAFSMLWWLRTSSSTANVRRPKAFISASNGPKRVMSRLVSTRSAPAFARARAMYWPRPRLVPVTIATRPPRSNKPSFTRRSPASESPSSSWARVRRVFQTSAVPLRAEQSP